MNHIAIEATGLTKKFGDVVALDGVSVSVPSGSVLGLLGPNGAGKTTAVRILTTIIRPDSGSARVLGYDVVSNASAVRYRIGLAGQYAAVDGNLTGRENLRLIGLLTQMERILTDEVPGVMLYFQAEATAHVSALKGPENTPSPGAGGGVLRIHEWTWND